jgi:hypothetical protein
MTSPSQIRALNPNCAADGADPRRRLHAEGAGGAAGVVKAKLTDASTAELASLRYYTVKRGDTLATIARTLRVSRAISPTRTTSGQCASHPAPS